MSVPTRRTPLRRSSAAPAAPRRDARGKISNALQQLAGRARSESGQTLVEYSLILMLIALVSIVALTTIGTTVRDFLMSIASQI